MARIIVGVDGSVTSAAALRWAAREAEARGAELVAVLVWDLFNQRHADGSRRFDPDYDASSADDALAAAVAEALGAERAAGVTRTVVCDLPSRGLLATAEDADLLVVGARGLGGFRGLLLGSVSQQCLHHATGPIAIVHGEGDRAEGDGQVVVGVDGSEASDAALRWALADAACRKGRVEVVHAWETMVEYGPVLGTVPEDVSAIEAAAERLVDEVVAAARPVAPDVPVERTVVCGEPASTLLNAAKGADLVVVGRRGRGGFARLLLGSVSEHVARHASTTVVVVPAGRPAGVGG
ncbi:MAG TPA: universal stress protein [Acidimicrobiales bacterium]|nr:universal stress protein [Acidimicrobiales bacterium]